MSYTSADQPLPASGRLPKFYERGICGHCHSIQWNGDCREAAARFTNQQLDDQYGPEGAPYGYRLRVYKRVQPAHRKAFDAEVRRLRSHRSVA
jgi:hypothetical protein